MLPQFTVVYTRLRERERERVEASYVTSMLGLPVTYGRVFQRKVLL